MENGASRAQRHSFLWRCELSGKITVSSNRPEACRCRRASVQIWVRIEAVEYVGYLLDPLLRVFDTDKTSCCRGHIDCELYFYRHHFTRTHRVYILFLNPKLITMIAAVLEVST